jgi:hypothetical protein
MYVMSVEMREIIFRKVEFIKFQKIHIQKFLFHIFSALYVYELHLELFGHCLNI